MNIRFLVIFIFAFLIPSYDLPCAAAPPDVPSDTPLAAIPDAPLATPSDKPTDNLFGTDITFRIETSPEAFKEALERARNKKNDDGILINEKLKHGVTFKGLAEWSIKEKRCIIYWPNPEFENPKKMDFNNENEEKEIGYKFKVLGHEAYHCMVGQFHD
ncbi:MAG: hypothetical protein HYT28_02150 [Parcubacteria group bacterium]|nr:hypothetical protein [Parcubacteria group bacterium]